MKPNQPSLFLFFIAIIFTIIFECFFPDNGIILYLKSVAIPLIFIYFLITNDYKIDWLQSIIFLVCFIGDIIIILNPEYSSIGSIYAFIVVYCFLLIYVLRLLKIVKIRTIDIVAILIIVAVILFVLISVLSISSYRNNSFTSYVVYGIVLAIVSFVCFFSYITRPTVANFFLTVMMICFILSDIFFVFNKFFQDLLIFRVIRNTTQVLAYYFMVRYFLTKNICTDKKKLDYN